ncbi:hypothetical protein D348_00136 [Enterococcus faecalis SLO2C-1]|nr:hypothetical protein D348_00136 [Enterococcus faecalis SLO2C-1]
MEALREFDGKWGKKYPAITKSWMDNWTELAFFQVSRRIATDHLYDQCD